MNICHVIDHMGLGGAQTIVRDLVDRNENHFLFSLKKSKNQVIFKNIDAVNRINISVSSSKYSLIVVKELSQVVRKNKIDILHLHLQRSLLIGYLLKIFYPSLNVKLIFHQHNTIDREHFFFSRIINLVHLKIDAFIAVSKESKELLAANTKLSKSKITVIYNYINLEKVNLTGEKELKDIREEIGISKENFVVGYAGRLKKYKGVDTIIKAIQFLDDPNIHLVIVGSGEYRSELEKLVNNSKNIHVIGFRSDMGNLYQIFNTLVLASSSEGNPMTFFESQAYNVPFIGSNIKSILEVVEDGENGLVFELGNFYDLADKIKMLKTDPRLIKHILENDSSFLTSFDIIEFEKSINEIYISINLNSQS